MSNTPSGFDLAVAAYQEKCALNNLVFQQPVEEYSKVIDDVIYLRTSQVGYVARYSVRRRRMLV